MEQEIKTYRYRHHHHGVSLAVFLIAVGVVFLGFNMGVIPIQYKNVFLSWQMLLIFLGCLSIIKRHYFGGLILMGIGTFFILPAIEKIQPNFLGQIPADLVQTYWPVLLIGLGVIVLLQWLFPSKYKMKFMQYEKCHHHHHHHSWQQEHVENGYINSNSVFGEGEHIVLDPEFKGGEINAVFGGIKLDLRKTKLPEGMAKLEINAVFGGVTIYVPNDWNVQIRVDAVFGGFEDKRDSLNTTIDMSKTLVIFGSCVFGGGELRN
jgi:predicted membrane protein